MGSPLRHICVTRTDFAKRKAKAKRDAATAARRQKRKAAAARKRARAAERRRQATERRRAKKRAAAAQPARPRHDYHTCREPDCQRLTCQAWREGHKEGYEQGFPDGMAACPRVHK